MSIVMNYDKIVARFNDNGNRLEHFKGENEVYFELVDKAILVVCKMAQWYSENELKWDDARIEISGGGGGGSKYTVYCGYNEGFWYRSIGDVEIDFEKRSLAVKLDKWRKDLKTFVKRKPYNKSLDLKELEVYKEKYNEVKEKKEETEQEKALKEIEEFSVKFGDLTNDYWFGYYYEKGDTFYQVAFYDRRNNYSGAHKMIACTFEQKEKIVNGMKLYNKKLKQLIEKYGKDTFTFTEIGENIGYCYVDIYVRSKKKDQRKRKIREKYSVDFNEVSCSSCGDGGCVHCEPSRFIDSPIY